MQKRLPVRKRLPVQKRLPVSVHKGRQEEAVERRQAMRYPWIVEISRVVGATSDKRPDGLVVGLRGIVGEVERFVVGDAKAGKASAGLCAKDRPTWCGFPVLVKEKQNEIDGVRWGVVVCLRWGIAGCLRLWV